MPLGRQTFYGVPFQVLDPTTNGGRAIVTLRGANATPQLPEKVEGIPVGNRVRCLYFLHTAAWGNPGEPGKYVVRYEDGQTLDVPLRIPGNTHNWWNGYDPSEESRPVPVRVTETGTGKPAWRYLRVWQWDNPRKDVAILSLDVVSNAGPSTPILIAVTGVR